MSTAPDLTTLLVAHEARERALRALSDGGQLAGPTDPGEQVARVQESMDAIERFNASLDTQLALETKK